MVLIFQLHVMDSRHARALLRGGPVLSTPCNGFGSLWIAWTQGAIFFQLHVMDSRAGQPSGQEALRPRFQLHVMDSRG